MKIKVLLFSLLLSLHLSAQDSSEGTEFWLAYMENLTLAFNDAPIFAVQITAEVQTSGMVSVPATGLTIPFTVPAGQVIEVTLPSAIYYSENSDQIENKGIKVTSESPIRVNAMHYRTYFCESSMVLPEPVLGDEYQIIAFIEDVQSSGPSSFVILSTSDDNEIEITPSSLTLGLYSAGIPYTITLDEGQIYQVQSLGDLTGSTIRSVSNEKIAVFSGAQQSLVENCGGGADSHIWDQALPLELWDAFYYFVPFKNQGGDIVRILANTDNTTVYLDCNETVTINAGDFFETKLAQATIINATAPIAVAQFNSSQDCNASQLGDPNMLRLLPTQFQNQDVRFHCSDNIGGLGIMYFQAHFTNIVMNTSDAASMQLDGNNIGNQFTPFPADPTLSYAQISISAGEHFMTADAPFYAYSYGWGDYDGYTSNLGFQSIENQSFICLEIEAEGTLCTDSTIVFSANANQEIASYQWTSSNGQTATTPTAAFAFSAPGEYTVTLVITSPTDDTYEAIYTFQIEDCDDNPCDQNPMIELQIDGDLCTSSPIDFGFTSALTYSQFFWNFGDGFTSTEAMPSHIYSTAGTYLVQFIGTDNLNCTYSQFIEIEILDCNAPCFQELTLQIITEGDLCINSSINFLSNYIDIPNDPIIMIEWTFSNGNVFDELTTTNSFDTPGFQDIQLFILTEQCFYFVNAVIEIEDCDAPCTNLPPVSILGNGPYCLNELETFSLSTTADLVDFSWIIDGNEVSTNETASFTFENTDTYTINFTGIDADGCDYESIVTILVEDCIDSCLDLAPLTLEITGVFCVDSTISFSYNTNANLVNWFWEFGDGSSSNEENPSYSYAFSDSFEITLIALDANDCEYSASTFLEIAPCLDNCLFPPPEIGILSEQSYCVGNTFQIDGFSEAPNATYNWNFSDGRTFSGQTINFEWLNTEELTITLLVVDENDCFFETVTTLQGVDCSEGELCELFIPTAFSPNNDGTNETFKALSDCIPSTYECRVFNRWGGLVFETSNFETVWDGKLNNRTAPSDVYAYVILYAFNGEPATYKTGDVTLLR